MTNHESRAVAVIVEENKDLSFAFEQALVEAGYDVRPFFDSQSAKEYFETNSPRLLMLDLDLKNSAVLDVLNFLRSSANHQGLQIILTSAQEQVARDAQTGKEIILLKPIQFNQLVEFARRLLPSEEN